VLITSVLVFARGRSLASTSHPGAFKNGSLGLHAMIITISGRYGKVMSTFHMAAEDENHSIAFQSSFGRLPVMAISGMQGAGRSSGVYRIKTIGC